MARHPQSTQAAENRDGEEVTILNPNNNPAEVKLDQVDDVAGSVVVADATANNPEPKEKPAEVRYYRVIKGNQVLMPNGMRTTIKEGKIIDNLNYDIRRLQMQGVRLERAETEQSSMIFVE